MFVMLWDGSLPSAMREAVTRHTKFIIRRVRVVRSQGEGLCHQALVKLCFTGFICPTLSQLSRYVCMYVLFYVCMYYLCIMSLCSIAFICPTLWQLPRYVCVYVRTYVYAHVHMCKNMHVCTHVVVGKQTRHIYIYIYACR